jgi:hypothetical protein
MNLRLVEDLDIRGFGARMEIMSPDGTTRYFSQEELQCPATHIVKLAEGFGECLMALRFSWGLPMIVNSCCRSEDHNDSIGGHDRSLHVYDHPFHPTGGTCAIDLRIINGTQRGNLIALAWGSGWSVGVAQTFVHLDRRTDNAGLAQKLYPYGA